MVDDSYGEGAVGLIDCWMWTVGLYPMYLVYKLSRALIHLLALPFDLANGWDGRSERLFFVFCFLGGCQISQPGRITTANFLSPVTSYPTTSTRTLPPPSSK